jgi:hypothetical protein
MNNLTITSFVQLLRINVIIYLFINYLPTLSVPKTITKSDRLMMKNDHISDEYQAIKWPPIITSTHGINQ